MARILTPWERLNYTVRNTAMVLHLLACEIKALNKALMPLLDEQKMKRIIYLMRDEEDE